MSTHPCPGCDATISDRLFACRGCWSELPTELKDVIVRTKSRLLSDPVRLSAVTAALQWYRATDPLAEEVAP